MSHRSLALLAVVVFSLVATSSAADGQASGGAVQIVKAFFDDLNAHRVDKAMRYVSPKAVFDEPIGRFAGRAAVRRLLEREVFRDRTVFHHSNFRVHGDRVVYDFRLTQDPGGIVAAGNNGLDIVKDGKIVYDGTEATKP